MISYIIVLGHNFVCFPASPGFRLRTPLPRTDQNAKQPRAQREKKIPTCTLLRVASADLLYAGSYIQYISLAAEAQGKRNVYRVVYSVCVCVCVCMNLNVFDRLSALAI
jgi:hypothetical protein